MSARPTRTLPLPVATERLWLREFVADDLPAMLAYGSNPKVNRYMLFAPDEEENARKHLAAVLRQQGHARRKSWELAAARQQDGQVVGACDLNLTPEGEGDLGYVLAEEHWGQGYGTEILRSLVRACFGELQLPRVVATIDVRNKRSIRVAEKAGLRWEGTLRRHVEARGRWWDVEVYALQREEWLAQG